MRIESDGTQIRGYQSLNGTDWTLVGRPANLPTGTVRVGVFALGNAAATTVTAGVRLGHAHDARWRRRRGRRRVRRHVARQDALERDLA